MPDVFTDATANDYDLTITTAADWTVSSGGLPNGDNYVSPDGTVAPTYNLNGDDFHVADGTAWTIEFWFYYTAATAATQYVVGTWDTGTATQAWSVAWSSTETMLLQIINTGGTGYMSVATGVLSTSTWYHLVFVKQTGAMVRAYSNNVEVATSTTTSGTPRTPTSSYRLYCGVGGDGNNDLGGGSNGARVAKLAIYNAQLTTDQINDHYLAMTAT